MYTAVFHILQPVQEITLFERQNTDRNCVLCLRLLTPKTHVMFSGVAH